MNRVVVDASAWVEFICGMGRKLQVAELIASDVELHIPALCDVEVLAVLRKLVQRQQLPAADAEAAIDHYRAVSPHRHGHEIFLPRIFELRDNFTAYDAA